MSKLFIDTNILISAIVFDGNELDVIIKSVNGGDEVFISEHIIEEATRVFLKKFPDYINIFENFIETSEIKIIEKEQYFESVKEVDSIRDKYDAHVIACAEIMNCDYIITGDKDLLTYSKSKTLIITSKEYLSL
jgi:putative PIN family toxin of toxin-antitoxin system